MEHRHSLPWGWWGSPHEHWPLLLVGCGQGIFLTVDFPACVLAPDGFHCSGVVTGHVQGCSTPWSQRNRDGKEVKIKRMTLHPLVRFQDLRHSTAMMLRKDGEPISIGSAMLGHARTRTTTDAYGHVIEES